MSATMKDVAAYANVSVGTVSNYISGAVNVSAEKRALIEKAIKELDYKVNVTARLLKTNSFKIIGVLIPDFKNIFILKVISVLEVLFKENNYNIMVVSYHNNQALEKEQLDFLSQRVDAIVYMPKPDTDCSTINNSKIPIVTFNEMLENVLCDQVVVNNIDTAKDTITKLITNNHKKIGLIAGPKTAYTTQQRIQGYKLAFHNQSLQFNEKWIKYGDYSKDMGYRLTRELLFEEDELTAIFIVGYYMTLGALAQVKKLKAPPLIIGYDAADIEDVLTPQISYIYQPVNEIAENIATLILKRINNDFRDFPKVIQLKSKINYH